jgi:hypothetical protein
MLRVAAAAAKHNSQASIAATKSPLRPLQQAQQPVEQSPQSLQQRIAASSAFASSFGLYLLSAAAPAAADVADMAGGGSTPFQGVTANSLYVTLALFLMTAPGECAS